MEDQASVIVIGPRSAAAAPDIDLLDPVTIAGAARGGPGRGALS